MMINYPKLPKAVTRQFHQTNALSFLGFLCFLAAVTVGNTHDRVRFLDEKGKSWEMAAPAAPPNAQLETVSEGRAGLKLALAIAGIGCGAVASTRQQGLKRRAHIATTEQNLETMGYLDGVQLEIETTAKLNRINALERALQARVQMDAQLAAFTSEIRGLFGLAEASDGEQEQLALPGRSLQEEANHQLDSSTETNTQSEDPLPDDCRWVEDFDRQTAFIWGNQGGGKSWLTRYIVQRKLALGYRVIVLDPDSNPYSWRGVESYHSDEGISQFIQKYIAELERRLEEFNRANMSEREYRQKLRNSGRAWTVVCEETSTWSDALEALGEETLKKFFKYGLTKSRKQEMPCLYVTHNLTKECLGGITGLHSLIMNAANAKCLATTDPKTKQPVSTGKAIYKRASSEEKEEVRLPPLKEQIIDFRTPQERLEDYFKIEAFPTLEDSTSKTPQNERRNEGDRERQDDKNTPQTPELKDLVLKAIDYVTNQKQLKVFTPSKLRSESWKLRKVTHGSEEVKAILDWLVQTDVLMHEGHEGYRVK